MSRPAGRLGAASVVQKPFFVHKSWYFCHCLQNETRQVELFTEVAPKYEFLNSLLTAGQDKKWREALLRASEAALGEEPRVAVDLACGTGDVARLMADRWPQARIVASDPNRAMLDEAEKRAQKQKPNWARIEWAEGRAEEIRMEPESVDLITIAFGFRNVPADAREHALREALRVLRPGGVLAILELGLPRGGMARSFYGFLLTNAMPHFAGLFSPKDAYQYLARSIKEFPEPNRVKELLKQEGFLPFAPKPLSGGMCWLFIGRKAVL